MPPSSRRLANPWRRSLGLTSEVAQLARFVGTTLGQGSHLVRQRPQAAGEPLRAGRGLVLELCPGGVDELARLVAHLGAYGAGLSSRFVLDVADGLPGGVRHVGGGGSGDLDLAALFSLPSRLRPVGLGHHIVFGHRHLLGVGNSAPAVPKGSSA